MNNETSYWQTAEPDDHHDSIEYLNRFGSNFHQLPESTKQNPNVIIEAGVRSHVHELLRDKNKQRVESTIIPANELGRSYVSPWHHPNIVNYLMMQYGRSITEEIYKRLEMPLDIYEQQVQLDVLHPNDAAEAEFLKSISTQLKL